MMANPFTDLINANASMGVLTTNAIQSTIPQPPTNRADFRLIKVSNGHILEMNAGPNRIVRIIPDGEDIGAHVTTALVEAKLEK